jgi:hypothetical protein
VVDYLLNLVTADYQRLQLNGRTVLVFYSTAANQATARERCIREGGDLFSPYTQQENIWLVDAFSQYADISPALDGSATHEGVWIGLGRSVEASRRNESVVWYTTGQAPNYTSWIPGEPNRYGDYQRGCVQDIIWQTKQSQQDDPSMNAVILTTRSRALRFTQTKKRC